MTNITISDYIKTSYKEYAIHTLTSRGIPAFEDSLTPVQRLILLNSPKDFQKTLSLVGQCIADGYPHGNAALEKSIARLARPYDCAQNLLEGYGFFGSKLNNLAAAARYTSIKINKEISDSINEYHYLNKTQDDKHLPLNLPIPIGLGIPIIGIAVGYRTLILPRKFKDIQDFFNGKRKSCNPYFKNFNGNISKVKESDNTWLLEGEVEISDVKKTLYIKSLPPLMNYSSFVKRLDKLLDYYNFEIENKSKTEINILIKIKDDWINVSEKILNLTKIIVKESLVFVKDDNCILEYSCIEDYLLDFKNRLYKIRYDNLNYYLNYYTKELEYSKAQKDFYIFMLAKKRTEDEVELFINKYDMSIRQRLDLIKAKKLNKTEFENIPNSITEFEKLIEKQKIEIKKYKQFLSTVNFNLHSKVKTNTLILDPVEINVGEIEVFEVDEEEIDKE